MTQGFLLFAYNNEAIDYGAMALWSARRLGRWLDKPVSLVTDQATEYNLDYSRPGWSESFDQVIIRESATQQTKRYIDKALTFKNLTRADAYDLSPYDETLVIDTDIAIQSTHLNRLWGHQEDLVVMDRSTDLFGRHDPEFTWIGDASVKFYWATQFFFRKGPYAEQFFRECQRVRAQYDAYRYLYNLPGGPVRNDYVWSIVVHTLGHSVATIPWNTYYSPSSDRIVEMNDRAVRVLGKDLLCRLEGVDLHIMNKFDLMQAVDKELA